MQSNKHKMILLLMNDVNENKILEREIAVQVIFLICS